MNGIMSTFEMSNQTASANLQNDENECKMLTQGHDQVMHTQEQTRLLLKGSKVSRNI